MTGDPPSDHVHARDSFDWVELSSSPLDVASAIAFVQDKRAGAVSVFLGTTRAEAGPESAPLVALDYQAYAEMAWQQMRRLVAEARARWPVVRSALLHRTGRVELGEASVVIAVSAPHRAQAFEACRFLIEELKQRVTIWKREVWADGSGDWSPGTPLMPPRPTS